MEGSDISGQGQKGEMRSEGAWEERKDKSWRYGCWEG